MFLNEGVYAGNKLHTPRPELAGRFGAETLVSNSLWAHESSRRRNTRETEGREAPKAREAHRFREPGDLEQEKGSDGHAVEHSVTAEDSRKAEDNTRADSRHVSPDSPSLFPETAVSQQPKPQEGKEGTGAFLIRRRQEQAGRRKDMQQSGDEGEPRWFTYLQPQLVQGQHGQEVGYVGDGNSDLGLERAVVRNAEPCKACNAEMEAREPSSGCAARRA